MTSANQGVVQIPGGIILLQIGIAMVAGLATAYQPGVNAAFASYSSSRLHGGVLNFLVGAAAMILVCLVVRTPLPEVAKLAMAPWWAWIGGLMGAFFVTSAIFLIKPMGSANYVAAMIAGQFIGTMIIDHFGLMGLNVHSFSLGRGVGLLLMVAGIVCIRYF